MEEGDSTKTENKHNIFLYFIFACCFIVIASSFYFFYLKKDFQFLIETTCDKNKEQCFERDCTNPDDCPLNGLSVFKRYSLKASDFKYCENEDCTLACETGKVKCTQIKCINDTETGWEQLCLGNN